MVTLHRLETSIKSIYLKKPPNTAPPRGICDVHPLRHALSGSQGGLVGVDAFLVFGLFVWLEVGSGKMALSHPAHQYPAGA